MKYVIATLGSAGDLHPFLAVARAMRESGHDVLLLSQEPHRQETESQDVPFQPIVSAHDHQRTLSHPALWHPMRGFGVLWRHLVIPSIAPTTDILIQLHRQHRGELCVLASPLVIGARLLREVHDFRLLTGHTAPSGLRSARHPTHIAGHLLPQWIPNFLRRAAWNWLDRNKLDPMARPHLLAWLAQHTETPHLPAALFHRWIHSPDGAVGLFPADFGPMPNDWPVEPHLTGFPLYERTRQGTPEPSLSAFLDACKEPPYLLYPGSVPTRRTTDFLKLRQHLIERGRPCIYISAQGEPERMDYGDKSYTINRVSLPDLLPRCTAFVHHGGIGACAQGIAANIPQFGLPAAYDQHDNSWRLAQSYGKPPEDMATFADQLTRMSNNPGTGSEVARLTVSRPGRPNSATLAAVEHITSGK